MLTDGSGPGDDFFEEADVAGSPLGAEDAYGVFGRATMKAVSCGVACTQPAGLLGKMLSGVG